MIIYLENPKESLKNLLQIIREFNTFAGFKSNIQNLLDFMMENILRKIIYEQNLFTMAKIIKYIRSSIYLKGISKEKVVTGPA